MPLHSLSVQPLPREPVFVPHISCLSACVVTGVIQSFCAADTYDRNKTFFEDSHDVTQHFHKKFVVVGFMLLLCSFHFGYQRVFHALHIIMRKLFSLF
jgi:hypothetical protein